jgi:hypothetical protein
LSRVSQKSFQKVAEQALGILFERYPESLSTNAIAKELGRDNEFAKKVMDFLHEKRYVALSRVSKSGKAFSTRKCWRLSTETHMKYSHMAQR